VDRSGDASSTQRLASEAAKQEEEVLMGTRQDIDIAQAWSAFEPSTQAPWSRRLAAHLFRRAGFSASWAEIQQSVEEGPAKTLDRLCDARAAGGDSASDQFERTAAALADRTVASGNPQQLSAGWLYRMVNTPDPLLEKLTLFWHGHFASSAAKVTNPRMMLDQNDLLRSKARGKFEDLVRQISRDPAMLVYLDSTTNRRIHPNENYGRELMELFCLGVGNYTERDIKEVARAFTGWEVLGDQFHFNSAQHDAGPETILGSTGNFDGDDAVRIILAQPAAPRFIARKLIRYFLFDEPAGAGLPDGLVEPVAHDLRDHEFEIAPVVRRILGSNLFFSDHSIGRKVRSPVGLGVGLLRALGMSTNLVKLSQGMLDLGQGLFFPPNVKGWDGGRAWINSATLLGRANLVRQTLQAGETSFDKAGGSLATAADRAGAGSPEQVVDWLRDLLLAVAPPEETRAQLVRIAAGADGGPADRSQRITQVIHVMSALPEFQLE
jgi:uncharacterized protein (DUF1800 family)